MKEVEILVEVYEDKEKVLDILKQFKFKGEKETLDIYYFDPLRDNFKVINNKFPIECFRLRNKNQKYYMTYKKDNFENETWIYSDEEEIEISDFKIGQTIVKNLGLKELIRINNKKHTYETKKYEIVFEEVKDLGYFLEVEAFNVNEDEDIKKVKQEIQFFIDKLGFKVSDELNAGKPELMLNKINNLDN